MVYGADGKERRDRGMGFIHVLIAQDDVVHTVCDRLFRLLAKPVEGGFQSFAASRHFEKHRQLDGFETFVADIAKNVQLCVGQYRMGEAHHLAMCFIRDEDVAPYGADIFCQAHNQFFTKRIDRRVRHLGELLAEIVEQQLRALGKDGQRRVVSHRTDRLCTTCAHRGDDAFDIFAAIPEGA